MHFLCSTYGSSGDVFPMLGLALELRQRGHEVTFATNEHYRGIANEYDLPFEALGDEAGFQACINHPNVWHPRNAFGHVFSFIQPTLRRQYELHAELAARGPLVSITNCFGLGALNAQDKLGVPVITLNLQPAVLWSDHNPPALPGVFGPLWLKRYVFRFGEWLAIDGVVCPFLNPWRKELGLPPVSRITRWWHSRFGVLCLFPEWYAPPQVDWPANLMQTDFPLWNHRASQPLSAEVETFLQAGDPPIVFAPGSTNVHAHSFFAAAEEACRRLGRRGILLSEFPEQLPTNLPSSIAHFSYVPLDLLLSRAAAFVHHGGVGSMSQAFLAGIPQALMPMAHDQFDNAARVQRLKLGAALPAGKFTGPRLANVLQPLLASPEVAAACREVAKRVASRDGLQRSAEAIEERLRTRVAQN